MNDWAVSMLLWSWQALVLTGVILVVVRVGRPASAAERHRYWLMGILGITVLPAANILVNSLPAVSPAVKPLTYLTQVAIAPGILAVQEAPDLDGQNPTPAPLSARWSCLAIPFLFGAWLTGVAVCLVRACRSYWKSRRLRAAARLASGPSPLPVGYSRDVGAPVLMGVLHPMILLPRNISDWVTNDERRAVVLHELAHFERKDHLVNLLRMILGAIFFFHPVVRYALGQLALERELACDERVLEGGIQPATYAEAILKVAARTISQRADSHPAFNTSGKILNRRMTMILDYRSSPSNGSRLLHIMRTTVVLGLALLLLPQRAVTSTPHPPVRVAAGTIEVQSEVSATPAAEPQTPEAIELRPAAETVQNVALQREQTTPQAAAQSQTEKLSGTVYDQTGARIPGVAIRLTNTASSAAQTAVSDVAGTFEFPQVQPGQYNFEAGLPGFTPYRRTVVVQSGAAGIQDVILQLASIAVQVEVSTARPQNAAPEPSSTAAPAGARVGGDVAAPNLIYSPRPVYPPSARAQQIQGDVHLHGVIGVDGSIVSLQLDPSQGTGNIELVQAAMDVVRQWRYKPAFLNNRPIEFATTITVTFRLVE